MKIEEKVRLEIRVSTTENVVSLIFRKRFFVKARFGILPFKFPVICGDGVASKERIHLPVPPSPMQRLKPLISG